MSRFENDRVVLNMELVDSPLRIDEYCDNNQQELYQRDPRLMDQEKMKELVKDQEGNK